ncbi:hypothetical protein NQ314_009440 [Rhamnusium bicolor]|uniref:DUF4806 domain-containing protein n=1 Tax=Rhamnusium bicolor TaxID=1586634 RepID=A0AAV8Y288_9CUCU|nr:hypothetical protein NQ314_009440 [Rhamnusium bicolor]
MKDCVGQLHRSSRDYSSNPDLRQAVSSESILSNSICPVTGSLINITGNQKSANKMADPGVQAGGTNVFANSQMLNKKQPNQTNNLQNNVINNNIPNLQPTCAGTSTENFAVPPQPMTTGEYANCLPQYQVPLHQPLMYTGGFQNSHHGLGNNVVTGANIQLATAGYNTGCDKKTAVSVQTNHVDIYKILKYLPSFSGKEGEFPLDFLRELEAVLLDIKVPHEDQELFLAEYWGESAQGAVRYIVDNGEYVRRGPSRMAEYFLDIITKAKYLSSHFRESDLIYALASHFSYNTERTILGLADPNISQVYRLLQRLDDREVKLELAKKILLSKAQYRKLKHDAQVCRHTYFEQGDLVWLRSNHLSSASDNEIKKFFKLYEGPYRVQESYDNNSYTLVDPDTGKVTGMTFVGVEFTANEGLAIISVNWLTLRKKEVFWPDSKKQSCYEKLLKNHTIPDEDSWQLYSIQRCFFNTELTSDLQSDESDSELLQSRKERARKRPISESSDSGDQMNQNKLVNLKGLKKISINILKLKDAPADTNSSISELVRSPIPEILGSSKARNLILGTPGSSKTLQSNDKLLSSIFYVREQNKLIISLLMQIVNKQSLENAHGILEEIPHLPINTEEDFIILENYLESDDNLKKLVNYLQKLGGKDEISKVNIILKKILTNELASRYNFFGKRPGKKPFSTLRLDAITRAILKDSAGTEKNVADVIIKNVKI